MEYKLEAEVINRCHLSHTIYVIEAHDENGGPNGKDRQLLL